MPARKGTVVPCQATTRATRSNSNTSTTNILCAMSLSSSPVDQHIHAFVVQRMGCTARLRVALNALDLEALLALATRSFSSPLLRKLYATDECVIHTDCIRDWLGRAVSWVVDGDREGLLGLVSLSVWEQCGLRDGDSNLLEIGLLASERPSCGRVLLIQALRECDALEKEGIVLELLGGKSNVPAYSLYREFGFVHEPRMEEQRRRHMRNEFNDILVYLTLRRTAPGVPLLTPELLQRVLCLQIN
jgi:hypothetical protein